MVDNIYNLKLHEVAVINSELHVIRVPGGWIYESFINDKSISSVFIPFNNEFQNKK